MSIKFASAIADCLMPVRAPEELRELVRVLVFDKQDDPQPERDDLSQLQTIVRKQAPTRLDLEAAQRIIRTHLPEEDDRIALVYGGATKIKGYVFEAPKLPEIRGASALLDRINTRDLRDLWID